MTVCEDAFQATWDALTHLLILTPAIADGPWSEPDAPNQWAKKYGMSWDTLKRRFDDGSIRHKMLTTKSYQIHIDDLPSGHKSA